MEQRREEQKEIDNERERETQRNVELKGLG